MTEPDTLTHDSFLEELREKVDSLREMGIEVPERLETSVISALDSAKSSPFEHRAFRLAAAHLLEGLDEHMADDDPEGFDLLEERLWSMPANLRVAVKVSAEHRELV